MSATVFTQGRCEVQHLVGVRWLIHGNISSEFGELGTVLRGAMGHSGICAENQPTSWLP